MGSMKENRYQCQYLSILRYPSENPHHKLHIIHKLVTYFDFLTSNFLDFLDICPISAPFLVISILDFFFAIFGHYSSNNTKYRYLNKVLILNDTKKYPYYFATLIHDLFFHNFCVSYKVALQCYQNFQIVSLVNSLTLWKPFGHHDAIDVEEVAKK